MDMENLIGCLVGKFLHTSFLPLSFDHWIGWFDLRAVPSPTPMKFKDEYGHNHIILIGAKYYWDNNFKINLVLSENKCGLRLSKTATF